MSQNAEAKQEEAKREITALVNKETQLAIMRFFLRTSVPRILKQQKSEGKPSGLGERE